MKISRVLVPVKGRSTDDEAITLACSVAGKDKGQVFAIYVIEVKRTLPIDAENSEEVARGERVLEVAEKTAKGRGFRIQTELLQARDVGPAIVDESVERQIDLIILGTDYKRRFGEFDPGKTIPYVLRNASCRVWVMREPILDDGQPKS